MKTKTIQALSLSTALILAAACGVKPSKKDPEPTPAPAADWGNTGTAADYQLKGEYWVFRFDSFKCGDDPLSGAHPAELDGLKLEELQASKTESVLKGKNDTGCTARIRYANGTQRYEITEKTHLYSNDNGTSCAKNPVTFAKVIPFGLGKGNLTAELELFPAGKSPACGASALKAFFKFDRVGN